MRSKLLLAVLVVSAYSTLYQLRENLIKNGNFTETFKGPGQVTTSKSLPGWEVPRKVEQGFGLNYNPNWDKSVVVVQLDSDSNDIIRQRFQFKQQGSFILELQHAARSGFLETSQMSISWNGHKLQTIKAEDFLVHTVRFKLLATQGINVLQIAGEGKSDGNGMTIANVRLVDSQETKNNLKTEGVNKFLINGNFAENQRGSGQEVQEILQLQVNYIQNGNFAKNQIGQRPSAISKSLPGWEIPNQVELGIGGFYNANWENTVVVQLDSNQNDVIRQKINLKQGLYILELQYAPRSGFIASSGMSIFWNGQKLKSVKPTDFLIRTLRLQLTAFTGTNVLEIVGEGRSDGAGMCIANVTLFESQQNLDAQGKHNFLKNGNFAKNQIGPGQSTISKSMPGWEIPNQVEFGIGGFYNANWGDTIVVELDSNQNDVIRQRVKLEQGEYVLELQYAPRSGFIVSSGMSIFWNGQRVKSVKAEDFLIRALRIKLTAFSGTNVLEIVGEAKSDGAGMSIANVTLVESQEPQENLKVQGNNLLINGNFTETFKGQVTISKNLPGWEVSKKVEQGFGLNYNPNWDKSVVVVQLDSDSSNDIIRQEIDLQCDTFILRLQFAARSGFLESSQMGIFWNKQKVQTIKAEDFLIHTLQLELTSIEGTNVLQIAGEGKIDGAGMTIANLGLFKKKEPKRKLKENANF